MVQDENTLMLQFVNEKDLLFIQNPKLNTIDPNTKNTNTTTDRVKKEQGSKFFSPSKADLNLNKSNSTSINKSPIFKPCLKQTSSISNGNRHSITHGTESKLTINFSTSFKSNESSLYNNNTNNPNPNTSSSSIIKQNSNNFNNFYLNTNEKSFSDVNYESKIQSLNGQIYKLNERLEKNMRKMTAQDKDLLFKNKKLKEAEILNMRLMNELSLKNQTLDSFNKDFLKKQNEIEKKVNFRINCNDNNKNNIKNDSAYDFVKDLSEKIKKEYAKLANPNSKINSYNFENVEIKLMITPVDKGANALKIENENNNFIEIDLSGNEYLKQVIQSINNNNGNNSNRCKSERERGYKKFHSSMIDNDIKSLLKD